MSGYSPIVQTLKARVLNNTQPFSQYGAAGSTAIINVADFLQDSPLGGSSRTGSNQILFNGADIPAIKSFAVVSPLGDGLASQPGTGDALNFNLKWESVNSIGATVGTPMANIALQAELFNSWQEEELYSFFNTPDAMAVLAVNQALGGVKTKLTVEFPTAWAMAAYSMAAGWDNALFAVWIEVVVSHTYTME